jgi:transposase
MVSSEKIGLCYKKKLKRYFQRDETKREEYLNKIRDIPLENLIYIDESALEHDLVNANAWLPKGKNAIGEASGLRHNRTTIVAGLNKNDNNILAPLYYGGTTDSETFMFWLEQCLLPELKPNQVIIMDNASIHKNKRIEKIIEDKGCKLLYLPPYSPDLNPIEHYWFFVKHWVGKLRLECSKFYENLDRVMNMKYVATEF